MFCSRLKHIAVVGMLSSAHVFGMLSVAGLNSLNYVLYALLKTGRIRVKERGEVKGS